MGKKQQDRERRKLVRDIKAHQKTVIQSGVTPLFSVRADQRLLRLSRLHPVLKQKIVPTNFTNNTAWIVQSYMSHDFYQHEVDPLVSFLAI